ncbi:hypothetical protein ABW19_dt0201965 [Dactylella cylindrospora]|nr:hypothetical protein ABW19_dt0201965 [Dactylella cylindrospora]
MDPQRLLNSDPDRTRRIYSISTHRGERRLPTLYWYICSNCLYRYMYARVRTELKRGELLHGSIGRDLHVHMAANDAISLAKVPFPSLERWRFLRLYQLPITH